MAQVAPIATCTADTTFSACSYDSDACAQAVCFSDSQQDECRPLLDSNGLTVKRPEAAVCRLKGQQGEGLGECQAGVCVSQGACNYYL